MLLQPTGTPPFSDPTSVLLPGHGLLLSLRNKKEWLAARCGLMQRFGIQTRGISKRMS